MMSAPKRKEAPSSAKKGAPLPTQKPAPSPVRPEWHATLGRVLSSRNFLFLNLVSIGGTTAGMGLAYLYRIISAGALTLPEYGMLSVLLVYAGLLGTPVGSLVAVLAREMAKRESRPAQMNYILHKYLLKVGLGSLLLGMLGASVAMIVGQPLLALILIGLPFSYVQGVFNSFLQATERIIQFSLLNNGVIIAKVLALVVFLALGWGVAGAVGALTVSAFIVCLMSAVYVLPKTVAREPVAMHIRNAAGLLLVITLLTMVLGSLDLLAVQHFLSNEAAGLYATAATTAQILTYLAGAIGTVLYPKIAKMRDEQLRGAGLKLLLGSMALLLPVFIGLRLVAGPFITFFYGPKFAPSIEPFGLLLFGALFLGASQLLVTFLYARHQDLRVLLAYLSAVLADLALLFFLVPKQGLAGAALSTLLSGFGLMLILSMMCALEIFRHQRAPDIGAKRATAARRR